MKSLAARFVSDADRQRITRRVQEVEKTTSSEIVPFVRSASYHYPAAALRAALAVSALIAVAATAAEGFFMLWGTLSLLDLWVFPSVFTACFLVVYTLTRIAPVLKRPFISRAEMKDEVEEAALTAFYRHRLAETRDRTGILLYVSVFERRVVVLADKGINDKVQQETWQQVVDIVLRGIREGRPADALCEAVTRCGELIALQFPLRAGDTDELHNLIVED
jgi:putative membrane protein